MPKLYRGWSDDQVDAVLNDTIPSGKNYAQCAYFCRTYLNKGFRPIKSRVTNDARSSEYADMHSKGMSYAEIAEKVGLSRQRVGIIVKKWRQRNKE